MYEQVCSFWDGGIGAILASSVLSMGFGAWIVFWYMKERIKKKNED